MSLDTKEQTLVHYSLPTGSNGHNPNNGPAPVPVAPCAPKEWSIRNAEDLYRVRDWGHGYFSVNPLGQVSVHPTQDPNLAIDLKAGPSWSRAAAVVTSLRLLAGMRGVEALWA